MSASKEAGDDYYKMKVTTKIDLLGKTEVSPWDASVPHAVRAAEGLVANNFCVIDDFIDQVEGRQLRDEVAALYRDGRMVDGQIGTNAEGNVGSVRPDMRTDKMLWMEGSEPFVGKILKRHILRMDVFAQKINMLMEAICPAESWAGCGRSKIMATCYPAGGSRYVAHYDNPNQNGRKLTLILYLNEFWKAGDGGTLRIKTKSTQVDIAPLFCRMLSFWSDRRCPHEVQPTAQGKDRFAITIWYLDDNEKARCAKTHAESNRDA
jgi:Rps23 Pro-64 3,4-dihydroxylase Tpa1-like proline 4-hydroxylase